MTFNIQVAITDVAKILGGGNCKFWGEVPPQTCLDKTLLRSLSTVGYAEFYHKGAQHPKGHAVRPAGPKAGMVMLSYTKAFASITLAIAIVIGQKSLELKQGVFISQVCWLF